MDWDAVIERNRQALKRVLAALVAMAGLDREGQSTFFPQGGVRPQNAALAEKSRPFPAPTLPRHLHRAVLRLLRPAEAAARRLVIVAARNVVLPLPEPPRPRKPKPDPKAGHAALRALGIAVVMSPADLARAAGKSRPHPEERREAEPRRAVLPLFDPPRYPFRVRRRTVPPHAAPRILSFGGAAPHRLPPPPAPGDPIDATRLGLRLEALASALDDLPKHARRFARWKMRSDRTRSSPACGGSEGRARPVARPGKGPPKAVEGARNRFIRLSPLRPGRPPGGRSARSRRPAHEVHEVLADLQHFAREALQRPDTS